MREDAIGPGSNAPASNGPASNGRVVVVGSFNVDHVWTCEALPRPGETLSGAYRTGPGGKGFNQAIAARRAGADSAFVCALGDDAGAQLAHSLAEIDGLDLRANRSDAPTGTAGIYVDRAGRNSIVLGPGANHALDADFVAAQRDAFAAARVVLAQLEVSEPASLATLRLARDLGAVAMLNPAPANVPASAELLALADLLTPNETEFAALLERCGAARVDADAIATMANADLHALCRALLPHGKVVITLGASGCFVSHADVALQGDAAVHYRMPAERVDAIDTTGAGDAFNGALAAAMATRPDAPFAAHVRFASRYAALSTERAGAALAMPSRSELEQRFGPA